jgi:hypothetical protein
MFRFIAPISALIAVHLMQPLLFGQNQSVDAPRKVQQVTLSPAKDASIRQKSGPARTFTLISLTEDSIKVRTSAGKEIEIEMDKIQTIRTRDGEFDYSPGEETFASLLRRATRINGVMVETVDVYDPIERIAPGEEEDDEERPRPVNRNQSGPEEANGEDTTPAGSNDPDPPAFTEETTGTQENTTEPAHSEEPVDPDMTASNVDDAAAPAPGTTIYTCANCGNELAVRFKDGDKCPHCGIVFWSSGSPAATASNSGGNGGNNAAGGYPEASGYPASTATTPTGAPSATAPGTSINSLGDVPMWMKVGFFVGLLVIGWLLLQRR